MTRSNRTAALLVAGVVAMAASQAMAQDWPQWRGPNRDAKVAGFVAPATWPKTLAPKWKVPVGDGAATPALVGDKLYVFSRQGADEVTRCLDAGTGAEVWQDKYAAAAVTGPAAGFGGPRSSPTVADGKVVTLGVQGTLSVLDAATGKKLWRKDDFPNGHPQFFTGSSPLVVDGMVIAQLGGPQAGALVAYDLTSGEQKWKSAGDSPAYSSPVLMTVGGTKLIVAMTQKNIIAVTLADGKQVWATPFAGAGMAGYNASTPIVDGETVIFSGGGRGTKAIQLSKSGDTFTGKELWSNPKAVQFNTPTVKDGMVYGLSSSNELFCINEKTGETVWGAPISGAAPAGGAPAGGGMGGRGGRGGGGGGGYGSILDAGSVLMALTPSEELVVFAPGDKFAEQARIKIAETPTHAYPIVSGNRLFIKDKDSVSLLTLN